MVQRKTLLRLYVAVMIDTSGAPPGCALMNYVYELSTAVSERPHGRRMDRTAADARVFAASRAPSGAVVGRAAAGERGERPTVVPAHGEWDHTVIGTGRDLDDHASAEPRSCIGVADQRHRFAVAGVPIEHDANLAVTAGVDVEPALGLQEEAIAGAELDP